MIINDISGNKIVETEHRTLRRALEYCAAEGVCLNGADLRKAGLSNASLDGLLASGACLWGADLTGADIGMADLTAADLRCANLKECCLAETDMTDAQLEGAYFSSTLLEGAVLDRARLSCPSFWSCDLSGVESLCGAVFLHLGEAKITLRHHPVVMKGQFGTYVFTGEALLTPKGAFSAQGQVPTGVAKALCMLENKISVFSKN